MTLTISDGLARLIEMKMKDGKFASVSELLIASLLALEAEDDGVPYFGDFEPGELERLIDEGLNSGEPVPGEVVHARIDAIIEAARRREQEKASAPVASAGAAK